MLIEVDGAELEVARVAGDAARPTIVLLHEGLGSVSAWGDFPQALSEATSCSVVAYSRAGYGRSTVRTEPFGVDYMHREAETVLPRLLDLLQLKSPVLFGHSDGASIALIFAMRFPGRSAALVLEAPHVFVEPVTVQSIAGIAERFRSDARLQRSLSRHHTDAAAAFRRWSEIWLDPAFLAWDITPQLAHIDVPVLLLQGASDEYGTAAQLEAIAKAVPSAQTVLFENSGHAPHRDARDAVLAATSAFLRGRLPQAQKKSRP